MWTMRDFAEAAVREVFTRSTGWVRDRFWAVVWR